MSIWTVRATIGGDVFTQQRVTDPDPDADPALPALLSVKWLHELEDGDAWPRPRALTTATVQLLVANASDAAAYGPTTVVHLELFTDELATTVVDSWSGRGSFPTIEPHELGAVVTIGVVSYLMDLDAYRSSTTMPAEEVDARLNRELGTGLGGEWAQLAARTEGASLLELARDTLSYGPVQSEVNPMLPDNWQLYELWPNTDAAGQLDPFFPWGIEHLPSDTYSTNPLELRERPDEPGVYELWADPATAGVIDAANVAMDATWSRLIGRAVNTVHVILADDTYVTATTAEPGDALVAYTLEGTELTNPTEALALAERLLPHPDAALDSEWEAEAFTVLLDHTPDGWYVEPLRSVMALGGELQRRHHPEDRAYWVGLVSSIELVASGGSASVTLELEGRPIIPSGVGLAIDSVPHPIDSLTGTLDSYANAT